MTDEGNHQRVGSNSGESWVRGSALGFGSNIGDWEYRASRREERK
uniref:Uncharacterized protein n=1 Tax=Oryza brachyantha TaxID=4533 RepID=J3N3R0_ORYBR